MRIHIVQKGDTLWKIAKKYGVNFEELKAVNTQLADPDMIMPGMKIKVPQGTKQVKKEAQKVPVKKEQKAVPPYKDTSPKPIPVIKEDEKKPVTKGVLEKPLMPMAPIHMNMPSIDQQMQNYYTTFHLPQMPMPEQKEMESEESPVVAPKQYAPMPKPCPPQLVHSDFYCCPPQPMGMLPAQMPMHQMPMHQMPVQQMPMQHMPYHQPPGCGATNPAEDYEGESPSMVHGLQAGGDCGCGHHQGPQAYGPAQGSYGGQQHHYPQQWYHPQQAYGGWPQPQPHPYGGGWNQGGQQGWGAYPQGQPWTPGPWRDDDVDED